MKDYTPTMWNAYFKECKDVVTERGTFRVYLTEKPSVEGPVLLLLHGGGFSALTWSHFCVIIKKPLRNIFQHKSNQLTIPLRLKIRRKS